MSAAEEGISLTLRIWRQPGPDQPGELVDYAARGVLSDMSFLEVLDVINQELIQRDETPIEFDSDCREGICGSCGLVIDGVPHGPVPGSTCCQLFMRQYRDGDVITVEPWRASAFPLIKDLVVDRSAFDRIIARGGYISVDTGCAQDGNAIPIAKQLSEQAMDAAACIGCGACVAACKNAAAMLFVGAKVTQLALLPQGEAERGRRATRMVEQMDQEGFGGCTNEAECEAVCPKQITTAHITRLNWEYTRAMLRGL